jgi:hypothetical protein
MVARLDAPQPVFALPPTDSITDGPEDKPLDGNTPVCAIYRGVEEGH